MLRGQTNSKILEAKDVKIWEGNTSRAFFDKRAADLEKKGQFELAEHYRTRKEGDAGPVYGFLMRHFGAKYVDCNTDYTGQGTDQIARLLDQVKNNPKSRQILVSNYDPSTVDYAALPPCHTISHYYVREFDGENRLCCHMFQRSCDIGLGQRMSYHFLSRTNVFFFSIQHVSVCSVYQDVCPHVRNEGWRVYPHHE
jgi:thymidylate synthase